MSSAPASPLHRAAGALDGAAYRVEVAFVTIASLVMTATVTLDIVDRSFRSEDSKIAEKIAAVLGWFRPEKIAKDSVFYGTLRDFVAPAVLVMLTFGAGWGIWASIRRHQDKPRPAVLGASVGVISVIAAYAAIQLILKASSHHVCFTLAVLFASAFFYSAVRRGHRAGMAAAALGGVATAWASLHLP